MIFKSCNRTLKKYFFPKTLTLEFSSIKYRSEFLFWKSQYLGNFPSFFLHKIFKSGYRVIPIVDVIEDKVNRQTAGRVVGSKSKQRNTIARSLDCALFHFGVLSHPQPLSRPCFTLYHFPLFIHIKDFNKWKKYFHENYSNCIIK